MTTQQYSVGKLGFREQGISPMNQLAAVSGGRYGRVRTKIVPPIMRFLSLRKFTCSES